MPSLIRTLFLTLLLTVNCFLPSLLRRAISYYLGLTPIRFAAFVGGTAAGRGFWSVLYAAIGAYAQAWVARGDGLDGLLTGLFPFRHPSSLVFLSLLSFPTSSGFWRVLHAAIGACTQSCVVSRHGLRWVVFRCR